VSPLRESIIKDLRNSLKAGKLDPTKKDMPMFRSDLLNSGRGSEHANSLSPS